MAARRTSRAPGPPDVDALSPAPVHLLVGDDEYQRDTQARRLVERLCPESDRALGLEIIEGAELATLADVAGAVRRCLEAVQTMGFFGVQKVVWFRDMKFLTDKRLARSTGLKDALEPLAGQIRRGVPEGVRLVLSGPGIDRRSGLFRACAEGGHTLEFNLPEKTYQQEAQARERAQALFAQAGIRIAPEDLDLFLAKTGNDTRQIMQEVDKVRLFLGDRDEAVWSDLQVIVSPAKEASSWELQDAFGARDLAGALRAARELLFHGASPIGLILGLQARCRDLILLKGCLRPERGWCRLTGSDHYPQVAWADNPDREAFFSQVSPNLPATHPYRVARLARQAQLFGPELLHIQGQLVRAHQDMIEGSLPKELVLEMTLLRVLRPHP
jgi:DNA polymerase-3 subunit delta